MENDTQLFTKALYIANRLDANADDVYDVLLGNITRPRSFVADVLNEANEYDQDYRKHELQ